MLSPSTKNLFAIVGWYPVATWILSSLPRSKVSGSLQAALRAFQDAAATNPADKEMIDALVERYPGKHQAVQLQLLALLFCASGCHL